MTRYEVPYACPNCEHDRWVDVDPDEPDSHAVKCPNCGLEDELKTPERQVEVGGLDELGDVIDRLRGS